MLISEVTGKTAEDIINEGDVLSTNLDIIILRIKDALKQNQPVWDYSGIIDELNGRTSDNAYLDPDNSELKNWVTQQLKTNGLNVDRGSGEVTMGAPEDVDTENPEEVEKKNKSAEIAGKAMDKIKGSGTDDKTIDGEL